MAGHTIPDWLIARVAAATGRSVSSGASLHGVGNGGGGATTRHTDAAAAAPADAHPLAHLSTAERLDLLARTKFPDGGGFVVVEEGEDAPVKLRDNLELHNLYLVRNLMDVYGVQPRLSMFLPSPYGCQRLGLWCNPAHLWRCLSHRTCPSLPELRHAQREKDALVKYDHT